MFTVNGTLPKDVGVCNLYLLSEQGVEYPYSRREIYQDFYVDFVVAPNAQTFQVVIECDGAAKILANVKYRTTVAPGQNVYLGEIEF